MRASRVRWAVSCCSGALLVVLGMECDWAPTSGSVPEEPVAASRDFSFRYETVVRRTPASAETAYLWVPVPPTTSEQTIHGVNVETRLPYKMLTEPRYGNRALRFRLELGVEEQTVAVEVEVTRRERLRPVTATRVDRVDEEMPAADPEQWLAGDQRVPINDQVRAWARETIGDSQTPADKARSIYDYVVTELKYDKSGTGWGNGDILWACDEKRGNCTDFHALFIGFNRAVGIPARFEMGFPIPDDRPEGEIGGYHCWAQFHLDNAGWIPVDASEATRHPEKREYFFGAVDENRVMFTVGRDLSFEGMQTGPMNFFIYPHVEVDGREWTEVEKGFSYRNIEADHS